MRRNSVCFDGSVRGVSGLIYSNRPILIVSENLMPTKTLSIISSVLTVVFILLLGLFIMFMLLVALNGFSDREGGPALLTAVICQGVTLILAAILAWRLTRVFVDKYNWNKFLSVLLSIFAGTLLFAGSGVVSFFISVIVTESLR